VLFIATILMEALFKHCSTAIIYIYTRLVVFFFSVKVPYCKLY